MTKHMGNRFSASISPKGQSYPSSISMGFYLLQKLKLQQQRHGKPQNCQYDISFWYNLHMILNSITITVMQLTVVYITIDFHFINRYQLYNQVHTIQPLSSSPRFLIKHPIWHKFLSNMIYFWQIHAPQHVETCN